MNIKKVENGKMLFVSIDDKYFPYKGTGYINPSDVKSMIEYRINMLKESMFSANKYIVENNSNFTSTMLNNIIIYALKNDLIEIYLSNVEAVGLPEGEDIEKYRADAESNAETKIRDYTSVIDVFCKALRENVKNDHSSYPYTGNKSSNLVKANVDLIYNFSLYLICSGLFESYDYMTSYTYYAIGLIKKHICSFTGIIDFKYI